MLSMSQIKKFLAPVLLGALLAMPAAAKSGNDGTAQQKAQQEMSKNKRWKDIQVAVNDGVATLTGTTDTVMDKVRAENKVKHVDGVSGVVNKVQINGGNVSDQQLYETIADKLRYDRINEGVIFTFSGRQRIAGNAFNSFNIDVKNGVVTLSGLARTDADAASALAIVQNTAGVKDVIDNVEVAPANPADDSLRIRIARAVYGDPVLQKYAIDPQSPIRIMVQNGHVTLQGMVLSEMDKQVAGMRAREVGGAFDVKNDLMVANQGAK
jgi:osmotically-inducible protein OsmY